MTRQRSEGGFTLVELLVTLSVMSVIIFGIASALIVVLHTYPADAARLTQDEAAQLLSSWLQADVLSAGASSYNINVNPATISGCSSGVPAGATNVVNLTWSDFDTGTQFEASYRVAGSILTRYFCIGGARADATKVGRNVQSAVATVFPLPPVPAQQVSVVVTDFVNGSNCVSTASTSTTTAGSTTTITADPVCTYTFTVSASLRTLSTPAGTTTLPQATTTTSTSTTTTTSTTVASTTTTSVAGTTTTAPSTTTSTIPVCMILSASASPAIDFLSSGNSGHLSQPLTVTVVTSGPCGPLTYSVDTGNGVQKKALAQCSTTNCGANPPNSTWTGFIDRNTFSWTDGSHPFSVLQGTPATMVPGAPNPIPFST